jgi:DNA-binding CsgD family transcriptional regulator
VVQFSSPDFSALQRLLGLLHKPLETPDFDRWRTEVNNRLQQLLGADTVNFSVPFSGATPSVLSGIDPAAAQLYFERFAATDPGHAIRRAKGLAVCSQRMIYPEDLPQTELYNDFFRPNRLVGGILMNADLPDGSLAFVTVSRETPTPEFERHSLATLKLLLPAFEAGMRAQWRLGRERASLGRFIDRLSDGAALFGPRGRRLLHLNPALTQILATDPEADRVRLEVEFAARAAGAVALAGEGYAGGGLTLPAGVRRLHTETGTYEVHASAVGAETGMHDRSIIVVVERSGAPLPDTDELAERYGLTRRECEVALLLARGLTDRAIAEELVISWHTARRHAERVLRKLGVGSRAEVGVRLLGG